MMPFTERGALGPTTDVEALKGPKRREECF